MKKLRLPPGCLENCVSWVMLVVLFFATAILMVKLWGIGADSALVGALCVSLGWFVWRRMDRDRQMMVREIQELYLCLSDEREFYRRKHVARMAAFFRQAIEAHEIERGLSLEETAQLLQEKRLEPDWRLKPANGHGADANREVVLHEYFYKFPTPSVTLQFKQGQLDSWKLKGY